MPDTETVYADGVVVAAGPFTIRLLFSASLPPTAGNQPAPQVADIAMSPEHAKVMAILMRKQLKALEDQVGQPIAIHPQIAASLGISPREDW